MHEFSAALSIIEAATEAANTHKVRRVTQVNVSVGAFTFLVPEQLEFNFDIVSKNTILEGAKLNITQTKGRLKCRNCGHEGDAEVAPDLPPQVALFAPLKCTRCGSSATIIVGGKEFIITDIVAELDTPTLS